MSGGLIQLAAYGSQDVYLTTTPEITFFKTVYKRYTNFAMESINQTIDGNINFGGNITVVISRNGDLLGDIVLQLKLFDASGYIKDSDQMDYCGWIQGVGNYLVQNTSIEIGGTQIDSQYGKWMDIWSELVLAGSQVNGYGTMVGKNYNEGVYKPYDTSVEPGNRLFVPLQYWFCRNPGLALPLIALQYHEVRLKISFEKFLNLVVGVKNGEYQQMELNPSLPLPSLNAQELKIWNTYYFLDTTERRKFAQNAHEYLIEQIQSQTGNSLSTTQENFIQLNLNHPTKELVFVFNRNNSYAPTNDFSIGQNDVPNGTPNKFAPLYQFKLVLNGGDRFKERPGEYFRLVQPYDHHTRIPNNYIYVYSFGLRPEEHQPSGTCNFSRIDSAQLVYIFRNSTGTGSSDGAPQQNYSALPTYTVYAPSYNILRIMGGMGGLAYSN